MNGFRNRRCMIILKKFFIKSIFDFWKRTELLSRTGTLHGARQMLIWRIKHLVNTAGGAIYPSEVLLDLTGFASCLWKLFCWKTTLLCLSAYSRGFCLNASFKLVIHSYWLSDSIEAVYSRLGPFRPCPDGQPHVARPPKKTLEALHWCVTLQGVFTKCCPFWVHSTQSKACWPENEELGRMFVV